jgi:hypothetical protein
MLEMQMMQLEKWMGNVYVELESELNMHVGGLVAEEDGVEVVVEDLHQVVVVVVVHTEILAEEVHMVVVEEDQDLDLQADVEDHILEVLPEKRTEETDLDLGKETHQSKDAQHLEKDIQKIENQDLKRDPVHLQYPQIEIGHQVVLDLAHIHLQIVEM